MNFSDLIEKAKSKDEKAIEELFECTSKKGYYVALKYLKNKEDAQDILQDAYVSALSKLDSLKNPEKFDKWLYQIIANKAKNYLVKNKPLLFEQLEKDEEDAISFEETIQDDTLEFQPKENCDYQELKQALKVLIDELPDDQRMCLLMYYFEELSINEIAESLELNTNTIKSRLNYARKKIKEKVEDLQKKGTHLYGIAPIPFLLWMLQEEAQAIAVPHISINFLFSEVAKESGKAVTKQGITILGKTISAKAIVISSVSAVVLLIGGTAYYQYSEGQQKQEIYDSLSIQFSDQKVLEYGNKIDPNSLVLEYNGDHIQLLNELDMKKVGNQTIQFLISKDGIERTFEVTLEIKDTKPPTLTLTNDVVDLTVGDEFDPIEYIKDAQDEIDGDLKEQVEIDNPVDINKTGEYEVNYSVKDKNGLQTESTLKVTVKDKKTVAQKKEEQNQTKEKGSDKKIESPQSPIDSRQTFPMDKLGLNMKVPDKMVYSGLETVETPTSSYVDENGNTVIRGYIYYKATYTGSDPALFGNEGMIITVNFYPFGGNFINMEGSQGLRYSSANEYIQRDYEVYDKGNYFLAYKQGIDYPMSGSAWVSGNDNESISIRVQSKDDTGVYAINIRANNFDRGFSLGIDGFKEKRIQMAREIFDSIQ